MIQTAFLHPHLCLCYPGLLLHFREPWRCMPPFDLACPPTSITPHSPPWDSVIANLVSSVCIINTSGWIPLQSVYKIAYECVRVYEFRSSRTLILLPLYQKDSPTTTFAPLKETLILTKSMVKITTHFLLWDLHWLCPEKETELSIWDIPKRREGLSLNCKELLLWWGFHYFQ